MMITLSLLIIRGLPKEDLLDLVILWRGSLRSGHVSMLVTLRLGLLGRLSIQMILWLKGHTEIMKLAHCFLLNSCSIVLIKHNVCRAEYRVRLERPLHLLFRLWQYIWLSTIMLWLLKCVVHIFCGILMLLEVNDTTRDLFVVCLLYRNVCFPHSLCGWWIHHTSLDIQCSVTEVVN